MPGAVHNDPSERGKRDMAPWNSPIPPHVRHGVPALAPEHAAIVDLCRNNSCRSAVVGKEALTIVPPARGAFCICFYFVALKFDYKMDKSTQSIQNTIIRTSGMRPTAFCTPTLTQTIRNWTQPSLQPGTPVLMSFCARQRFPRTQPRWMWMSPPWT